MWKHSLKSQWQMRPNKIVELPGQGHLLFLRCLCVDWVDKWNTNAWHLTDLWTQNGKIWTFCILFVPYPLCIMESETQKRSLRSSSLSLNVDMVLHQERTCFIASIICDLKVSLVAGFHQSRMSDPTFSLHQWWLKYQLIH